jgi:hypothetical protein
MLTNSRDALFVEIDSQLALSYQEGGVKEVLHTLREAVGINDPLVEVGSFRVAVSVKRCVW